MAGGEPASPSSPSSPPGIHTTLGAYELVRPAEQPGAWVARLRTRDGIDRSVVVHPLDEVLDEGRLDPAAAERMRLIQERSHPAMIALLDVCRDGPHVFAVTEHVPGASLADVVDRAGGLSPEVVGTIAKEVCLALDALHGRPGVRSGAAPIAHGGVDQRAIRISRAGQVRLTCPVCTAPRAESDGPAEPAGDLFALGLALRSLVPPGSALSSVLARATTVHPQLRYPNAGAMRLALDQALRSVDPNQGPRERRRRSEAIHAQLATLVDQVLGQSRGQDGVGATIPLDRHDFVSGPGSLFIDVEQGEGEPTGPAGTPAPAVSHRRDRRTLEMAPSGELGPAVQAPVELERVPGHRAGRPTLEAQASPHDTEVSPALHPDLAQELERPAHQEVSDLLVVDAIPRGDEAPPAKDPPPAVKGAGPAAHGAPERTVSGRPAYRSASRRVPLMASAQFRLLLVALAVLGALLISLSALLVDRGRRAAEARFVPAAPWDLQGPSEQPPGAVSPL